MNVVEEAPVVKEDNTANMMTAGETTEELAEVSLEDAADMANPRRKKRATTTKAE